jgi:predicted transposase/invertase (TIGR01784 family)
MSRFMAKADRKAQMNYAKAVAGKQGWRKGKKEGIKESIVATARNMLAKDFSIADIIRATDLSREQIRALKR